MTREAASALAREYAAGTVIFEENDPGSRMYVVREGQVKIYRANGDKEIVLAFIGPGDFFGEMALLENLPRSASAMTVQDSVLIEVDGSTFEEMIRRNVEVAVRIMRKLAGRVRELDRRVEKLLIDTAVGRALEVLRWLLPQGLLEGNWIRVRGAAEHLDIGAQAGVSPSRSHDLEMRLIQAGCMRIDGDDLLIAQHEILDAYGKFLDLKRRYDPLATFDETAAPKPKPDQAMKRLLKALALRPEEVEARRDKLAREYEHYLELRERFKAAEDRMA